MANKNVHPMQGSADKAAHKLPDMSKPTELAKAPMKPNEGHPPGIPDRILQLWGKVLQSLVQDFIKPILDLPGVVSPDGTKVHLGVFVVIGVCMLIWAMKR